MSSNIRITRVCQFCNQDFVAKTTVTKYCSDTCAKRAYKARKKAEKIMDSHKETEEIRAKPMEEIKAKEFLTVRDTAKLLNCSVRTIYRLIQSGNLNAVNLSERKTLVKRTEVEKLFV